MSHLIWFNELTVSDAVVCVVLIQEYNLLCSLNNNNRGLLKTVKAGRKLGDTLGTMTRLRQLW